jgi:general stress protein 26
MNKQDLESLSEVMEPFDTAMLVTQRGENIRSRPMAIAEASEDGHLWFLTSSDSGKIDELSANPSVNVVMQSERRYLSLSGTARAVPDRDRIEALWSPVSKAWFDGPDDPQVTALEIVPDFAEFWDLTGMKGVKAVVRIGAAILSDDAPDTDDDVNRKLDFGVSG